MEIFAVKNEDQVLSVWRDYDNAEAAAGEAGAMDPESCYSVEAIEESDQEFWFYNPHLKLH